MIVTYVTIIDTPTHKSNKRMCIMTDSDVFIVSAVRTTAIGVGRPRRPPRRESPSGALYPLNLLSWPRSS